MQKRQFFLPLSPRSSLAPSTFIYVFRLFFSTKMLVRAARFLSTLNFGHFIHFVYTSHIQPNRFISVFYGVLLIALKTACLWVVATFGVCSFNSKKCARLICVFACIKTDVISFWSRPILVFLSAQEQQGGKVSLAAFYFGPLLSLLWKYE